MANHRLTTRKVYLNHMENVAFSELFPPPKGGTEMQRAKCQQDAKRARIQYFRSSQVMAENNRFSQCVGSEILTYRGIKIVNPRKPKRNFIIHHSFFIRKSCTFGTHYYMQTS